MRRLSLGIALGGLLALAGSGVAAPRQPIKPDPDRTTSPPVGAADRVKNGPSPLATPPVDAGNAADPDDQSLPIARLPAPH